MKYPNSTSTFFLGATGIELTNLHIYLPVTLFLCLTYLVSLSIQEMVKDVQSQILKRPGRIGFLARKWKQSYGSIYDLIEEIDQFFGPILLLLFMQKFVFFVALAFRSIFDIEDWSMSLVIHLAVQFSKIIVYMTLLTSSSHRMKQQV